MIAKNLKNQSKIRRIGALIILTAFLLTNGILPPSVRAQEILLPAPGAMLALSPAWTPPLLKGIKIYPDDPFRFDFILDKGDTRNKTPDEIQVESTRLIKYFLASLTTPETDLWVNLSPYEQNRIVPEAFGKTEMGRDLLAQDYLLKQITASVMYPESEAGRAFWDKVRAEAQQRYGTTDVPVDTFNKVWIVPDKAAVYENNNTAIVVESRLKVMLEGDYFAQQNSPTQRHQDTSTQKAPQTSTLAKEILREIVIPILETEVNEGQNFAPLRQVYHSLILATWYKRKLKNSVLGRAYVDQNKTAGINIADTREPEKIWARYIEAFTQGVYNYIREEQDPVSGQIIPRRYFSGGAALRIETITDSPSASGAHISPDNASIIQTRTDVTAGDASENKAAPDPDGIGIKTLSVPKHHNYSKLTPEKTLALHKEIADGFQQEGLQYSQRFIDGMQKSGSPIQLTFEPMTTKKWESTIKQESLSRTSHAGFVQDEDGIYWIIKQKEQNLKSDQPDARKNFKKRELLSYLLMRGKANFNEIRGLSVEEAEHLNLPSENADDYYLTRVVTDSNVAPDLPHKETSRAFSALFVGHIFLRKHDPHLKNLAYINHGVPVSIDNDIIFIDNNFKIFAIDFLWHSTIQTALPLVNAHSLQLLKKESQYLENEKALLKKYPDGEPVSLSITMTDLGLGKGYVKAEYLNKKYIAQSIAEIKSVDNIRGLAEEAGYSGNKLAEIEHLIKSSQASLGANTNYIWKLLTGENGGFTELDVAQTAGSPAMPDDAANQPSGEQPEPDGQNEKINPPTPDNAIISRPTHPVKDNELQTPPIKQTQPLTSIFLNGQPVDRQELAQQIKKMTSGNVIFNMTIQDRALRLGWLPRTVGAKDMSHSDITDPARGALIIHGIITLPHYNFRILLGYEGARQDLRILYDQLIMTARIFIESGFPGDVNLDTITTALIQELTGKGGGPKTLEELALLRLSTEPGSGTPPHSEDETIKNPENPARVDAIASLLAGMPDLNDRLQIPHYHARWHREGGRNAVLKDHLQRILNVKNSLVAGTFSEETPYQDLIRLTKKIVSQNNNAMNATILTHDIGKKERAARDAHGNMGFRGHEDVSYELITQNPVSYNGQPLSPNVLLAVKYHDLYWKIDYQKPDAFDAAMRAMHQDFSGTANAFEDACEFLIAFSVIDTLGSLQEEPLQGDLSNIQQFFTKYLTWKENRQTSPGPDAPAIPDEAASANFLPDKGGIDLNPSQLAIETTDTGDAVTFEIDPAVLQQIQDAPGMTPVIIGIQPLESLTQFMGVRP